MDPFLELNLQTFLSSRHLWGRWLVSPTPFFHLTDHGSWGYEGFLRKLKELQKKYWQDLQQLSCRDLLYKGQATEELSVNIHFILVWTHTQWAYLCLMLFMFFGLINQYFYPAQITTSPDEQPSTLSIRWVSANKYKLNWNRKNDNKNINNCSDGFNSAVNSILNRDLDAAPTW